MPNLRHPHPLVIYIVISSKLLTEMLVSFANLMENKVDMSTAFVY